MFTGALCGEVGVLVVDRLVRLVSGSRNMTTLNVVLGVLMGIAIAAITYAVTAPTAMVTRCLIDARERFLDGLTTVAKSQTERRKCLRKLLLY